LASKANQSQKTACYVELHRLCYRQVHGFAPTLAGLVRVAFNCANMRRIIRLVEKPDLAHARARVGYHLTGF
jgi:hypothetical protein